MATQASSASVEHHLKASAALGSLEPGVRGTFVRVSDADPEMLRCFGARGVAPGDAFEVVDRQPFGGPLLARFGAHTPAPGAALANAMRVEVSA